MSAARALVCALALVACADPPEVRVRLTATHPRPADAREAWSARFQAARDRSLLAILRASAKLAPPGLVLDAAVRVDACTPESIEATRSAVVDLATRRHRFAIHRAAPERAKEFAAKLRERLDIDVSTPYDEPGKVIVMAPFEVIGGFITYPDGGLVRDAPAAGTVVWAIEPTPAIEGDLVDSASVDGDAIDVNFSDVGADRLAALSGEALGRHLVIIVDGQLAVAPRVMQRVSRTIRLALPPSQGPRALELARAIAASNLLDPPTLVAVDADCRP